MPDEILRGREAERYVARLIRELSSVYEDAGNELQRRFLTANTNAKLFRANELIREVNATTAALDQVAYHFAEEATPIMYQRGDDIAARAIAAMGEDPANAAFAQRLASPAIQVLTDDMALDFLLANQAIKGTYTRAIRATQQAHVSERAISRTIAKGIAQGDERRKVSKKILDEIADKIGTGKVVRVVGKDGKTRHYDPRYYSKMGARTRTREAVTEGAINNGLAARMDLIQVSVHDGACDQCQHFQGKVYSITGNTEGFPILLERSPFHPNCKHVMVPVTARHLKRLGQLERTQKLSNEPDTLIADRDDWIAKTNDRRKRPRRPARKRLPIAPKPGPA